MANSKNNTIQVSNLSVIFNDVQVGLQALENVNFAVKKGEFVSIIGPSGCGKSTLFRALGDMLDQEDVGINGEIKIAGETTKMARENRKIGLVFQTPTLLEWRSVLKNVELPLEIMKIDKNERRKRAKKLLKMVGLEQYSKFRPSKLSGGMQQRVSIARALAYNPEVLLMDEPFGALDEVTRRKMNDELIEVWKRTNKTILFVTHSIEEAVYLSEKIIVLSKRPGTIKDIIDVKLKYPRKELLSDVKFFNVVKEVRENFDYNNGNH
ncbi:ATP-binding cassette domain-containing protein [Candidatus Dojkabacteria bacterium]|nr:ATP-binding cassette domain-containing protein [Candidatus Dojkabacteria bacterium]